MDTSALPFLVLAAAAVSFARAARRERAPERTYVMIKPDGVQRGLVGQIIKRFEAKGYVLVALKLKQATRAELERHYADLRGKAFFASLITYMSSAPVVCMAWEGAGVVAGGRRLLGATRPADSLPGTIRADFAVDVGRNLIHASDSRDAAEKELAAWFPDGLVEWTAATSKWVYE